jgi:hypothetical protein
VPETVAHQSKPGRRALRGAEIGGISAILMTAAGLACTASQASPAMPTDPTVQQGCDAKKWPLSLPNAVGKDHLTPRYRRCMFGYPLTLADLRIYPLALMVAASWLG